MTRKALVIRLGALGDILHTIPTVRALAASGLAVDYLTDPAAAPLVEGQPGVRAVLRYDRRGGDRGARGLLRLLRRLRAERYDVVVDLHGGLRTRLIGAAVGARRLMRYRKDPPGTSRHAVDNFAAAVLPLRSGSEGAGDRPGEGPDPAGRVPRFVPGPAAVLAAEAALAAAGLADAEALVALHPGATHAVNRWGPERFGVLAARLAARPGLAVVLTGSPGDRAIVAEALRHAVGPASIPDLSGRLDLPALAALFARCAVVVAADTGPLHLAAAVGTRTVALFGAADPVRTGPVGEGHRVVRVDLECVPCRARRCHRRDRPHACMEELTVEVIESAVTGILEARAGQEAWRAVRSERRREPLTAG